MYLCIIRDNAQVAVVFEEGECGVAMPMSEPRRLPSRSVVRTFRHQSFRCRTTWPLKLVVVNARALSSRQPPHSQRCFRPAFGCYRYLTVDEFDVHHSDLADLGAKISVLLLLTKPAICQCGLRKV